MDNLTLPDSAKHNNKKWTYKSFNCIVDRWYTRGHPLLTKQLTKPFLQLTKKKHRKYLRVINTVFINIVHIIMRKQQSNLQ